MPPLAAHDVLRAAPRRGNILRNAVRYSPPGSVVKVALDQRSEWICLSVRDFGPGAPEEMLELIFDPFFQVIPARSASQKGLGPGQGIARRAIEIHGDSLRADNAMPGLRVWVELPANIS